MGAQDNFRPRWWDIKFSGQNGRRHRSIIGYSKVIEKNGFEILIINFGVMGEPAFATDITRQEVAKAGGGDLATLASGGYKDGVMRVMAVGPAVTWDKNAYSG